MVRIIQKCDPFIMFVDYNTSVQYFVPIVDFAEYMQVLYNYEQNNIVLLLCVKAKGKNIMVSTFDENGIEYAVHNKKLYYTRTHAAKYIGMTDSGFRRKMKKIADEQGINIPLIMLPQSMQNKYIDKRILDVFRKSVVEGREQEWYEELRRVVNEVTSER